MPALAADRAVLLVVDLQEKLMPAIAGAEAVLANSARLVTGATRLGVEVRATEQNPRGLGPTVEAVAPLLPAPAIAKTSFAADVDLGPGTVVVAGCEAHVCVLQTVLGLRAAGRGRGRRRRGRQPFPRSTASARWTGCAPTASTS